MAFLDRLVSDLIRSSTGYNARPFVRAIGGKNLVLLGGAAIAGALAAEKMRAPHATKPPPPPPIPSVPGAIPPPLPPPIPETAPAETEIPQELLFGIVRTMVAGALADGEMHAEEKKLIESRLGESGLSPDQVKQIHKDMVLPPPPSELAAAITDPEEREMLYRFGALVVLADEETTALEEAWLHKLASSLGLDDARCRTLREEIFQAE
jgi:uncharacterized membrane protein YebE (DUF533 family)